MEMPLEPVCTQKQPAESRFQSQQGLSTGFLRVKVSAAVTLPALAFQPESARVAGRPKVLNGIESVLAERGEKKKKKKNSEDGCADLFLFTFLSLAFPIPVLPPSCIIEFSLSLAVTFHRVSI